MFERFWDKKGNYNKGIIKEYDNWILEVSYKQHTLGSFIIFAKRPIENINELEMDEFKELKTVMSEIEISLSKLDNFHPDKYNYWQMGNSLSQLHFHGIPRYKEERSYAGKVWRDNTWGSIPVWNYEEENTEIIKSIRDDILFIMK